MSIIKKMVYNCDLDQSKMMSSSEHLKISFALSCTLITAVIISSPMSVNASTQIAQASTVNTQSLVSHLNRVGIKFFGTHWCPACKQQKLLFGLEAARLPYIECDKPKDRPDDLAACRTANIRSIPTWLHPNGRRLEGLQSLETLVRWSGMTSSQ